MLTQQPTLLSQMAQFEEVAVRFLAKHSLTLLRLSIGIVFIWFGALKLFPGLSPAEPLIRSAMWFMPLDYFIPFVSILEIIIGIGFVTGKFQRVTIILLLMQMAGAMSPIILSPERIWSEFPFVWTLEGQYVFKDIILISAGLVIGATVRGGHLTSEAE
jgi:uncharacterized membrane protein YkgB